MKIFFILWIFLLLLLPSDTMAQSSAQPIQLGFLSTDSAVCSTRPKPCFQPYNDTYPLPTSGGSGSSGVTSINSTTGAFTFSGSGVNCSGTTCNFNGGATTTIGTSLSTANPQVSGHANSGLYSAGTDVETIISGSPELSVSSNGVGIGTTSPSSLLDVFGTSGAVATIDGPASANLDFYFNGAGVNYWQFFKDTANNWGVYDNVRGNNALYFQGNGNSYLYEGNITIGTTSLSAVNKLEVNGSVAIGTSYAATTAASNGLSVQGEVSIGTSSPIFGLQIQGNAVYTGYTGSPGAIAIQNASITSKYMYMGFDPNISGGFIQSVQSGTGFLSTFINPNGGTVSIGGTNHNSGSALDISSATSSILLPVGTTGQEPSPATNGMLRYNNSNNNFEGYQNNTWTALSTTTGTVTAIGVTTANGVSGTSSGGSTPNLTITLGAITPSSVSSTSAVTTTLSTAASQGASGFFIPFSTTAALSANEIVSGTNISSNTVIAALGSGTSAATTTANGAGSGNTVVLTSATGVVPNMLIYDTTTPAHVGNQCVVNFVNGTTIGSLCSLASVANGETLVFRPTVVLSQSTTGTIGSAANVNFTTNTANVTATAVAANGDLTMGGKLNCYGGVCFSATQYPDSSSTPTTDGSVAAGIGALASANAEGSNTAVGYFSLNALANINPFYNTNSLSQIGNGFRNVSIGYGAMGAYGCSGATNGTGVCGFNTAIGALALYGTSTSTGYFNTALGTETLFSITTGEGNVAAGNHALRVDTTGSTNVGIGLYSLSANVAASSNVAIGYNSMLDNASTGGSHVAIGAGALQTYNNADNGLVGNVAVGASALNAVATGTENTALGTAAGFVTTGSNNTLLGFFTGGVLTSGSSNTIIGPSVGSTVLTTGSSNVLIGVSSAVTTAAANTSNTIEIGGTGSSGGQGWVTVTGTNTLATEAAIIRGTISIPDTGSDATLTDNTLCLATSTNLIKKGSGTLGICLGTSSKRYKKDILPLFDGLAQVESLKPVNFYYKKGYGDDGVKQQYGFLAEDTVDVLPKLTGLDKDGKPNSVDILGMVPVIVKSIQEQQEEIKQLKPNAIYYHRCVSWLPLLCEGI